VCEKKHINISKYIKVKISKTGQWWSSDTVVESFHGYDMIMAGVDNYVVYVQNTTLD